MAKAIIEEDFAGRVFERLTVISFVKSHNRKGQIWQVQCSCGEILTVLKSNLVAGTTKSCGCLKRESYATLKPPPKRAHHTRIYDRTIPSLSLMIAQASWFYYEGCIYSVVDAPDSIFKSKVREAIGEKKVSNEFSLLMRESELDITSRWWFLLYLKEAKRPIQLFASRDEAEEAVA